MGRVSTYSGHKHCNGIKIKKAGMFINPILKGKFESRTEPEYKNPKAPHNAIINPIVAALPIAFFIG